MLRSMFVFRVVLHPSIYTSMQPCFHPSSQLFFSSTYPSFYFVFPSLHHPPIHSSPCFFIHLFIEVVLHLSFFIHLSVMLYFIYSSIYYIHLWHIFLLYSQFPSGNRHPSILLPIHPSSYSILLHLFIYPSMHPSFIPLFIHLFIELFFHSSLLYIPFFCSSMLFYHQSIHPTIQSSKESVFLTVQKTAGLWILFSSSSFCNAQFSQ